MIFFSRSGMGRSLNNVAYHVLSIPANGVRANFKGALPVNGGYQRKREWTDPAEFSNVLPIHGDEVSAADGIGLS